MEGMMEHNLLTLEFGRDTVTYEGRSVPTGTFGCEALNIPDSVIASLSEPCRVLNEFIAALGMMSVTAQLLERARAAAMRVIDAMSEMEPFSHLDHAFYAPSIADAFTPEAIELCAKLAARTQLRYTVSAKTFEKISERGQPDGLLALAQALVGAGVAVFVLPNTAIILEKAGDAAVGRASGLIGAVRTGGQLSNMVIITVTLALVLGHQPVSRETLDGFMTALHWDLLLFGLFNLAAMGCALCRDRAGE